MAQIFAGQRVRVRRDFGGRAVRHDFSAMFARRRAEINNIIRAAHGFFVMLDDENRVPQIPQRKQHVQEFRVVALMQADARLIKNIQHADQTRSNLRGKPDALAFAAGKRRGGAVKRQIIQPHVRHKIQPRHDFFDNRGGNDALLRRELY